MGTEAQVVQPTAAENLAAGLKERRAAAAAPVVEAGAGGAGGGDVAAGAEVKVEAGPENAAAGDAGKGAEAGKETPKAPLDAQEELKQLKERLATLEGREAQITANRKAQDAVEDFIRSKLNEDLPREMLRKLLPVTADAGQLTAATNQLRGWVDAIIKAHVKAGVISYRQIGGSVGGEPISGITAGPGKATDNIAQGLRQMDRSRVVEIRGGSPTN